MGALHETSQKEETSPEKKETEVDFPEKQRQSRDISQKTEAETSPEKINP